MEPRETASRDRGGKIGAAMASLALIFLGFGILALMFLFRWREILDSYFLLLLPVIGFSILFIREETTAFRRW